VLISSESHYCLSAILLSSSFFFFFFFYFNKFTKLSRFHFYFFITFVNLNYILHLLSIDCKLTSSVVLFMDII
jgi:hypothetical protein